MDEHSAGLEPRADGFEMLAAVEVPGAAAVGEEEVGVDHRVPLAIRHKAAAAVTDDHRGARIGVEAVGEVEALRRLGEIFPRGLDDTGRKLAGDDFPDAGEILVVQRLPGGDAGAHAEEKHAFGFRPGEQRDARLKGLGAVGVGGAEAVVRVDADAVTARAGFVHRHRAIAAFPCIDHPPAPFGARRSGEFGGVEPGEKHHEHGDRRKANRMRGAAPGGGRDDREQQINGGDELDGGPHAESAQQQETRGQGAEDRADGVDGGEGADAFPGVGDERLLAFHQEGKHRAQRQAGRCDGGGGGGEKPQHVAREGGVRVEQFHPAGERHGNEGSQCEGGAAEREQPQQDPGGRHPAAGESGCDPRAQREAGQNHYEHRSKAVDRVHVDLRHHPRPDDLQREEVETGKEREADDERARHARSFPSRFTHRSWRMILETLAARKAERDEAGGHGGQHGRRAGHADPDQPDQHEGRGERAAGRAERVHGIHPRRGRAEVFFPAYHRLTQHRQRPAHQEGGRKYHQQGEAEPEQRQPEAFAEHRIGTRDEDGSDEQNDPRGRDAQFQPRVGAQRAGDVSAAPAPLPAAQREAAEKQRERERGGVRGVPQQQPRLPHPEDLIDQAGEARKPGHQPEQGTGRRGRLRRFRFGLGGLWRSLVLHGSGSRSPTVTGYFGGGQNVPATDWDFKSQPRLSLPHVNMESAMPVRGERGGGVLLGLWNGVEPAALDDEEFHPFDGADFHLERLVVVHADERVAGPEVAAEEL